MRCELLAIGCGCSLVSADWLLMVGHTARIRHCQTPSGMQALALLRGAWPQPRTVRLCVGRQRHTVCYSSCVVYNPIRIRNTTLQDGTEFYSRFCKYETNTCKNRTLAVVIRRTFVSAPNGAASRSTTALRSRCTMNCAVREPAMRGCPSSHVPGGLIPATCDRNRSTWGPAQARRGGDAPRQWWGQ